MTIGFAVDTNILRKNENGLAMDKDTLDTVDLFLDYIDALQRTRGTKKLEFFMPEVVLEELLMQKKEKYNLRYESFSNNYNELSYGLIGELPKNNIEKILSTEKEKYQKKLNILSTPVTKELLEELIKDALEKNPPFDKSIDGGKADAGFKDALIWKSIVLNKEIDKCKKFYFFTVDKAFNVNQERLIQEFQKFHKETELRLIVLDNDEYKRNTVLQRIIKDNNLMETHTVKLYDKNLILDFFINKIRYNYLPEVSYIDDNEQKQLLSNVNFEQFDVKDFDINSVEALEDNKYRAEIIFKTLKYKLINNADKSDDVYVKGKIILDIKVDNGKVKVVDYSIKTVDFIGYYRKCNYEKLFKKLNNEIFYLNMQNALEQFKEKLEVYNIYMDSKDNKVDD